MGCSGLLWWRRMAASRSRTGRGGGSRSSRHGWSARPIRRASSIDDGLAVPGPAIPREHVLFLPQWCRQGGECRAEWLARITGRTAMMDQLRAGVASGATAQRLLGAAAIVAVALACGKAGAQDAATATSAEDFGGMEGLIAAAQEEGELNVIALPPDWANYGKLIDTFAEKYGIEINSAQPDASSQDEINAANQLRGQERAPDVFDLGANVALRNTDLFAPYKVATWDDIPEALKAPDGLWVSDYGGYMSIGYDAGSVPAPTSVKDLLKPDYAGKVAL